MSQPSAVTVIAAITSSHRTSVDTIGVYWFRVKSVGHLGWTQMGSSGLSLPAQMVLTELTWFRRLAQLSSCGS